MKKIKIILVLISLSAILFAAPKIEFAKTNHDFGEIKEEGGNATFEFEFKNTGDEPLKLEKVKAS